MANSGIELTEEILRQKYIDEELSISKISKELNYSPDTIHKRLKKYGLNRNKSEAQKLKCVKEGVHNKFFLDENLLKKLYLEENLTSYEIADFLSVSQFKVHTTLKNMGINKSVSDVMKKRIIKDETRLKFRLLHIERIKSAYNNGYQITPFYNKNSIYLIEKYGLNNNLHFQHAENGGEYYIKELGYWVDGYDIKNNVVLEFDEKHHNKQIIKDNKRQEEIIKFLKCDFIRLNEDGIEKLKIKYNGK